jgi:hypothetical protein
VLEQTFYKTAHAAVPFVMEQLGVATPLQSEFGLINVRGVHYGVPKLDT